jgi:hypothetical protein
VFIEKDGGHGDVFAELYQKNGTTTFKDWLHIDHAEREAVCCFVSHYKEVGGFFFVFP